MVSRVSWFEVGASGTGFEVPDASQRVTSTATGRPLKRWWGGDQGFGNVGAWAAEIYTEQGGIVTTVSDASGALHNDAGLDIVSLRQHLAGGWKLTDYPNGAPQLFLYGPKIWPHQVRRCNVLDIEGDIRPHSLQMPCPHSPRWALASVIAESSFAKLAWLYPWCSPRSRNDGGCALRQGVRFRQKMF